MRSKPGSAVARKSIFHQTKGGRPTSTGQYTYYSPESYDQERKRHAEAAAQRLSEARLVPDRSNPDYLLLLRRVRHFKTWLAGLPADDLTVLDVGGRIQPYRKLVEDRARLYVAIDPQIEGMADVVGFGESLPFADESFDACICAQVLTYARDPQRLINEIRRVLKPGGTAFVSAPAFFPEHHDERWRFLPAGHRRLFSNWSSVRVLPEGGSLVGAARTANLALIRTHGRIANRLATGFAVPLINELGRIAARWASETKGGFMTANYCILAVKPTIDVLMNLPYP